MSVCEPPRLWDLAMAAPGNSHRGETLLTFSVNGCMNRIDDQNTPFSQVFLASPQPLSKINSPFPSHLAPSEELRGRGLSSLPMACRYHHFPLGPSPELPESFLQAWLTPAQVRPDSQNYTDSPPLSSLSPGNTRCPYRPVNLQ